MTPSHPSSRGQIQPALAVALGALAVAVIAVGFAVSRPAVPSGPAASERPSATPVASPSSGPSATPVPVPSAQPSKAPSGQRSVELRNVSGHQVTALVSDTGDRLVEAASGLPGDGMSVQWHKAIVTQSGTRAITVTWAGLPRDDTVDVTVDAVDGRLHVTIVQAGPVPDSDAMGEDRAIVLTFDGPVAADDVSVEVLDRTVD